MFQTFKWPFPNIKFNYTSTKKIEQIFKSIKTKHSHGYDEIPTKILKFSATFIKSSLTYMCNKSLSSGIFPTRLKFSLAKPAFENGDELNISNYRPISQLTAFSKVFEKVIYARLYQQLSQSDILLNEQHGFRSNSSTELASFKLINEILLAMSN
jgi:Notch-like protein